MDVTATRGSTCAADHCKFSGLLGPISTNQVQQDGEREFLHGGLPSLLPTHFQSYLLRLCLLYCVVVFVVVLLLPRLFESILDALEKPSDRMLALALECMKTLEVIVLVGRAMISLLLCPPVSHPHTMLTIITHSHDHYAHFLVTTMTRNPHKLSRSIQRGRKSHVHISLSLSLLLSLSLSLLLSL